MGWPRKNDGSRLYQERKDKSFLLVITENGANPRGHFDAIANVHADCHAFPCLYFRQCPVLA